VTPFLHRRRSRRNRTFPLAGNAEMKQLVQGFLAANRRPWPHDPKTFDFATTSAAHLIVMTTRGLPGALRAYRVEDFFFAEPRPECMLSGSEQ
jgi:hypothetical protein